MFFLAAYLLYSCGGYPAPGFSSNANLLNNKMISAAKSTIRSGDVILRSGKDFTSYRIRELSDKDKTYSHAGIAWVQDTSVYIYHITPPELDEPAADTAMRLETLEQFASPKKCFGFGVVRYQLKEEETAPLLNYLNSLLKKKVSFDHYFHLDDDTTMYCSEMVDKAFRYATHDRIFLERKYFTRTQALKASRYFHLPLAEVIQTPYISIDNMQLNPYCTVIYNYVFLK